VTKLQMMADQYYGKELGYVYVMEFKFITKNGGSRVLYKVGVTKNKPIDRMLDICRSFFQSRRYVPESRLVRFRKVASYYEMETKLHRLLDGYRFKVKDSFSGSTEFFDIDKDKLLEVYDSEIPKPGK